MALKANTLIFEITKIAPSHASDTYHLEIITYCSYWTVLIAFVAKLILLRLILQTIQTFCCCTSTSITWRLTWSANSAY